MTNTKKVIVVVVLVVLILLLLGGTGMAMFGWRMPRTFGNYAMTGGGFGFHPLSGLLRLAFCLFVVGGAALVVWWFTKSGAATRAASSAPAVDILKIRYAKGEITKEQFDQMKRDLET